MTGGVSDYSYSWIGPGGFTSSETFIEDLSGGNYTLISLTLLTVKQVKTLLKSLRIASECVMMLYPGFNDGAINQLLQVYARI